MQKAIRIIALTLGLGFVIALIVFNVANPPRPNFDAWNDAMTLGDKESAMHHFVMYTDLFCPYCDQFSNAVAANQEDFEQNYLKNKQIYFEVRVTDMNYASGHSDNSRPAGEGAYCAAEQGKFWEYYHELLGRLYEDYHSKGIGVSKSSKKIPTLEMSYFYDAAEAAGLGDESFQNCLSGHKTLEELSKNTARAQQVASGGVPYFAFGGYRSTGFGGNWKTDNDYDLVKTMLEAGLAVK